MASSKSKKYVRISAYGNLMFPIELLPQIVEQGLIVSTTWEDGKNVISKVESIDTVNIHDYEEIEAAIVQSRLSGEN